MLLLLLLGCSALNYSNAFGHFFNERYNYIEVTKCFYKFHNHGLSWFDAKKKCEAEGASLYYPTNTAEVNAVTSFWRDIHDTIDKIYVGLSDFHVRGRFQAIGGHPNNATGNERNEHCVMSYKNGTILNDECSPDHAFICKKNSSEPECDTDHRSDYQSLETTNANYKFHTEAKPWVNASQECESEGAILFYPTNETEINAVTKFWKETHDTVHLIYIGINDLAEKGNYETVDGGVPYMNWHSGEPNDAKGTERCVLSYEDGTFLDDNCTRDRAFICKRVSNRCT